MILVGFKPSNYQTKQKEISFIKWMAVDLFTRSSAIFFVVETRHGVSLRDDRSY